MRKLILSCGLFLLTSSAYGDIVNFTDGTQMEGVSVVEDPSGVWIDGLLFKVSEIKSIIREEPKKETWLDQMFRPWNDYKKEQQRKADLKAYEERMKRNAEVLNEIKNSQPNIKYDSSQTAILERARRANLKNNVISSNKKLDSNIGKLDLSDKPMPNQSMRMPVRHIIHAKPTQRSSDD